MAVTPIGVGTELDSETLLDFSTVLDEFTAAWERGDAPVVEAYLGRIDPADSRAAVDLIYREFCLLEIDGCKPDVSHYLNRFARHRIALERLFRLDGECPVSLLGRWMETTPSLDSLPDVGDAIGPYVLRRELGCGGFARVFLAEQTDLENRLVVLKVSTRMTREPWLLARVRHAHIVEIVSHARVNDDAFQLICMPFWGGATLDAILTARRRSGRRPASGIDLLADLDAVAAPEFPTVHAARPAREMLAGLSYSQAVAWIGARLAEALDHAFSRNVAHGDVKPSNILLSADGNPLLLDFNLARDWSPAGMSDSRIDPGGTLAYMAPERLRALATGNPPRDATSQSPPRANLGPDREINSPSRTFTGVSQNEHQRGPHQADIYALGMVLLEALTGRPPSPVAVARAAVPGIDFDRFESVASAYATARAKAARATLHEAEAGARRTIPPGLRAILERCLDPDPTRRYRRGLELAEDLDRWRADRRLICASEPFLGQTVPRLLRRQRRAILTAALSLTFILATTAVALVKSRETLRALASHKLARLWDDPDARAYGFQRMNAPRLLEADESRVATAGRALKEYDVLGTNDWRLRDDVRALPQAEREDLEVWLMEQVCLYSRALADRPNSPKDWSRAVKVLDHVGGPGPIPAFATLRHRLNAELGTEAVLLPTVLTNPSAARVPFWTNEYLLGVAAECELESDEEGSSATDVVCDNEEPHGEAVVHDPQHRTRRAAERARDHYNKFLVSHPGSFWGHYRAAVVSYGLGSRANFADAATHLEKCLERRPNNVILHNHLAASLMALDRYREAQQEIETAIEGAPDLAELYRTRARLRTTLRETSGLAEDLYRFELLSKFLPRAFWGQSPTRSGPSLGSSASRALPFRSPFDLGDRLGDRTYEPGAPRRFAEIDPEELVDRADLASSIRKAGEPELAEAELGKILILEPNHIGARMTRAIQAIETGRLDEAFLDIEAVVDDPGLVDYLRNEHALLAHVREPNQLSLVSLLDDASRRYCSSGRVQEGRMIASRALDLAIALDQPTGESDYDLARAYVFSGEIEQKTLGKAANQLFRAFVENPLYKQEYAHDPAFNAVRARLDAILENKPDPSAEYHRRLAAMSAPGGR